MPSQITTGMQMLGFYFKNKKREGIPLLFFSLFAALIPLFSFYAYRFLFDYLLPAANFSYIVQFGMVLFFTALSSMLFFYLRSLAILRFQGLCLHQLQSGIWDRLLRLHPLFFRPHPSGNLIGRVMGIEEIRNLLAEPVIRAVLSGIFTFLYLAVMFFFSSPLAVIGLGFLCICLGATLWLARFKMECEKITLPLQGRINSTVLQMIRGSSKLRVAGAENRAFSYWASLFAKNTKEKVKGQKALLALNVLNTALAIASLAGLFAATLPLFYAKAISLGTLLTFNSVFGLFSMMVFDFSTAIMQATSIIPLWQRSKQILEAPQEEKMDQVNPGSLSGEIKVENLYFHYQAKDFSVLKDLCLHMEAGKVTAIVGPSGCGKSTLVRLLLGFESPQSGAIYYDGKNLDTLDIHKLRKQIGVVLHESTLFTGSIYDNLTCGKFYSQSQIDKVLQLSGFEKDLVLFPMKLHTLLPMGGNILSGGQKQKLMIARALLPEPKILILDDATSALDNQTQEHMNRQFDVLKITRIVISHRLNTIKKADKIYIMEHGRIVDSGKFEELKIRPGPFLRMVQRQQF
jgi:NHLM bacteriocin system ABC transporter ATP-binding protein